MKPLTLPLIAILVLSSISLSIPMAAAAFTEHSVDNQTQTAASTPQGIATFTNGNYVHVFYDSTSSGINHRRSSDNGVSWSAQHNVYSAIGSGATHFIAVDEDTLMGCYVASPNINIVKSNDNGNSWSLPVIAATGTYSDGCKMALMGTTVLIAYGDSAGADLEVIRSTDQGVTWGSPIVIDGTDDFQGEARESVAIVPKNATVAIALYMTDGDIHLQVCKTTDTGATWSGCVSLSGTTTSSAIDSVYVTGDRWDYVQTVGAAWKHCKTDATIIGTTCTTIGTVSGSDQRITLGVDPTDNDRIIATFPGATTTPIVYSITEDGGQVWTTTAPVFTTSVSTFISAVDATLLPNGNFAIAYNTCNDSSDTNAVDCSSGGAARRVTWLTASDFADVSTSLGATVSATVTDLTGFAVDPTGTRAIARTDAGKYAKLWSATTLGTPDASVNTNCDLGPDYHNDMVFAKHDGDLVAFINCADENNPEGSGGPGDPQFLSIRTPLGAAPTADDFDGCPVSSTEGNSYQNSTCPYNIDLSEFDEPADSLQAQLGQIQEFPVSYVNGEGGNGFLSYHRVAWGFSATDGQVGVAVFTKRMGTIGETQHITRSRGYATSVAEDFCVGEDNGEYYLGAVDSATQSKSWPLTWTNFASSGNLDVSVNAPHTLASGHNAIGIACGGGQVAVVTGTTAVLMPRDGGSPLKTITGITGTQHGVFISEEFNPTTTERCYSVNGSSATSCRQFWGFVDGSTVKVYDAFNGEETCTLAIPAGTAEYLVSNNKAGWAWVATNGNIYGYNIQAGACTTEAPVGQQPLPTTPDDGEGVPGTGLLIVDGQAPGAVMGAALGIGAFGGNLLMASSMIFSVTIVGAVTIGGLSKFRSGLLLSIGAGMGVIVGFLLAWGFGFLNDAAVFVICVLIVLGLVVGALFLGKGG